MIEQFLSWTLCREFLQLSNYFRRKCNVIKIGHGEDGIPNHRNGIGSAMRFIIGGYIWSNRAALKIHNSVGRKQSCQISEKRLGLPKPFNHPLIMCINVNAFTTTSHHGTQILFQLFSFLIHALKYPEYLL